MEGSKANSYAHYQPPSHPAVTLPRLGFTAYIASMRESETALVAQV